MSDTNGKYVDETPRIFDPTIPVTPPTANWRWWAVAFLVIQSAIFFCYSSSNRHELDENAKLIKQLQERIIVKDLANLRKASQ